FILTGGLAAGQVARVAGLKPTTIPMGYYAWALAFSPDGKALVAGGDSSAVTVRDLGKKKSFSIQRHDRKIGTMGVAYSPDGKMIATGSEDRTVVVWGAAKMDELFVLKGHTGTVNGVAFSPDSKFLATGSDDGSVRVWDLTTQKEIACL